MLDGEVDFAFPVEFSSPYMKHPGKFNPPPKLLNREHKKKNAARKFSALFAAVSK